MTSSCTDTYHEGCALPLRKVHEMLGLAARQSGDGPQRGELMEKRLYRSGDERMIWGVCGGLGKYFNLDPTTIRLVAVLTLFFGLTSALACIILAVVVPVEP